MKIVVNIGAAEFSAIKNGEKPFFVHRSKVAPKVGQGILFQCPEVDEDLELTIGCVHDEPGIHKGYYILSFVNNGPHNSCEKSEAKSYAAGTLIKGEDGLPDIVLGTKDELIKLGFKFENPAPELTPVDQPHN